MTMFANLRRDLVLLPVVLAALVAAAAAGGRQPRGEPFSTVITKLKDGLYVIPGYDGAATGGNVAVRVTSDGIITEQNADAQRSHDGIHQKRRPEAGHRRQDQTRRSGMAVSA